MQVDAKTQGLSDEGTILDQVEGFAITSNERRALYNEFHSLRYLWVGLELLFERVRELENSVLDRLRESHSGDDLPNEIFSPEFDRDAADGALFIIDFTNSVFDGIDTDFVQCAFHWYSVSLCNYVRTVGWIMKTLDEGRQGPLEYEQSVIPRVKAFRNKVGAHFERIKSKENPAVQAVSVMSPVGWMDAHFYATPFYLFVGSESKSHSSQKLISWSLTREHRIMQKRYVWKESDLRKPDHIQLVNM